MASRALKPTLVIVMAAGLAAGIGLARPDLGPSSSTDSPAAVEGSVAPDGEPAAGPYAGPPTRHPSRRRRRRGRFGRTDGRPGGHHHISDFDFASPSSWRPAPPSSRTATRPAHGHR